MIKIHITILALLLNSSIIPCFYPSLVISPYDTENLKESLGRELTRQDLLDLKLCKYCKDGCQWLEKDILQLLKDGANPNGVLNYCPLMDQYFNPKVLKSLLAYGANARKFDQTFLERFIPEDLKKIIKLYQAFNVIKIKNKKTIRKIPQASIQADVIANRIKHKDYTPNLETINPAAMKKIVDELYLESDWKMLSLKIIDNYIHDPCNQNYKRDMSNFIFNNFIEFKEFRNYQAEIFDAFTTPEFVRPFLQDLAGENEEKKQIAETMIQELEALQNSQSIDLVTTPK